MSGVDDNKFRVSIKNTVRHDTIYINELYNLDIPPGNGFHINSVGIYLYNAYNTDYLSNVDSETLLSYGIIAYDETSPSNIATVYLFEDDREGKYYIASNKDINNDFVIPIRTNGLYEKI